IEAAYLKVVGRPREFQWPDRWRLRAAALPFAFRPFRAPRPFGRAFRGTGTCLQRYTAKPTAATKRTSMPPASHGALARTGVVDRTTTVPHCIDSSCVPQKQVNCPGVFG